MHAWGTVRGPAYSCLCALSYVWGTLDLVTRPRAVYLAVIYAALCGCLFFFTKTLQLWSISVTSATERSQATATARLTPHNERRIHIPQRATHSYCASHHYYND